MHYSRIRLRSPVSRRGFTLVEVLIGSALLVFLLGAFVQIAGSLRKQRVNAERLERAVTAVDQLLSQWSIADRNGVPLSGTGPLPDAPDLYWTIERRDGYTSPDSPFIVVQLKVQDNTVQRRTDAMPILVMNLVRPLPQ
jgi:prepilin-type N-terminal cleavage/methylation domain-containing protein